MFFYVFYSQIHVFYIYELKLYKIVELNRKIDSSARIESNIIEFFPPNWNALSLSHACWQVTIVIRCPHGVPVIMERPGSVDKSINQSINLYLLNSAQEQWQHSGADWSQKTYRKIPPKTHFFIQRLCNIILCNFTPKSVNSVMSI